MGNGRADKGLKLENWGIDGCMFGGKECMGGDGCGGYEGRGGILGALNDENGGIGECIGGREYMVR